jgi:hypothetical protein
MWKLHTGKLSDRDTNPTYALVVNEDYKALYMDGEYVDNTMPCWSINEDTDHSYILENFESIDNYFPNKLIEAIEEYDPEAESDELDSTESVGITYEATPGVKLTFDSYLFEEDVDTDIDLDDDELDGDLTEEFGGLGVGDVGSVDVDTGEESLTGGIPVAAPSTATDFTRKVTNTCSKDKRKKGCGKTVQDMFK